MLQQLLKLKRTYHGSTFISFVAKDDQNSGYQEILPWKDTDIAIRELGTMIDDIKTMGDAAIEKWKVDR